MIIKTRASEWSARVKEQDVVGYLLLLPEHGVFRFDVSDGNR